MTVFMLRVVNHRHHATSRAAYKKLSREGSCKDQIMLITSKVERQEIEQAYHTSQIQPARQPSKGVGPRGRKDGGGNGGGSLFLYRLFSLSPPLFAPARRLYTSTCVSHAGSIRVDMHKGGYECTFLICSSFEDFEVRKWLFKGAMACGITTKISYLKSATKVHTFQRKTDLEGQFWPQVFKSKGE